MEKQSTNHSDILRLFGELDDHKVEEIIELGPSLDELEVAFAYVAGMNDVMGKERRSLAGRSAQVYEIVTRDDLSVEEEYR